MIVVYKYDNNKILFCGKSVEDIPQNIVPKFLFDDIHYAFYGFLYYNTQDLIILDTNNINEETPETIIIFFNTNYKEYQKHLRQHKLERICK